jgi:hypothetical protein
MSRKRYKPEQIIGMLRQTEVELARGKRMGEVLSVAGDLGAELLSLAQRVRRTEA